MDIDRELLKLLQAATSDEIIRKEIVREVIYKEARLLAVGTKVVPEREFGDLDIKISFPEEMAAEYPVPEYVTGELVAPLKFVEAKMTLQKAVVRYAISDESLLRQLQDYQARFSRRRASEALAKKKDAEILDALKAGAGQTVTVAAGNEWDTAAGKPADDIVKAIGLILDKSNILDTDIRGMAVIVPTTVYHYLLKLQTIENVMTTVKAWFEQGYGLRFYPTRHFDDDAIVMVPGEQTAVHGVLRTNLFPLVEEERVKGRGYEYIIRQYFKTLVIPESSTQSTSNRICKISNVYSGA